jgi:aspartate aminotransferase-like enzyme
VPTLLYLDSARLGLMSERARQAHLDYLRFAGEEGCSLYFDQFLREGFSAWPRRLRGRYRHLSDWQGVGELKNALVSLASPKRQIPTLLANRSAQLMRLAARQLVARSHHILVTDLTWPSYRRILERERLGTNVGLTTVPLRNAIFHDHASVQDIVHRIVSHYEQRCCDGLFLPAVNHEGVRLPIESICGNIRRVAPPQFVVVDGAQAFCHVPVTTDLRHCDVFLTGCHKWLQAHVPMGVAFLPNPRSATGIASACHQMLITSDLDDPLLAFVQQLEDESLDTYSETVNLGSLFACRAAIADHNNGLQSSFPETFQQRLSCAVVLSEAIDGTGWRALFPQKPFRTGMLLAHLEQPSPRSLSSGSLRAFFLAHGIAVTTYDPGIIRFSMPHRPWSQGELDLVRWTLRQSSFIDDSSPKTYFLDKVSYSAAF